MGRHVYRRGRRQPAPTLPPCLDGRECTVVRFHRSGGALDKTRPMSQAGDIRSPGDGAWDGAGRRGVGTIRRGGLGPGPEGPCATSYSRVPRGRRPRSTLWSSTPAPAFRYRSISRRSASSPAGTPRRPDGRPLEERDLGRPPHRATTTRAGRRRAPPRACFRAPPTARPGDGRLRGQARPFGTADPLPFPLGQITGATLTAISAITGVVRRWGGVTGECWSGHGVGPSVRRSRPGRERGMRQVVAAT